MKNDNQTSRVPISNWTLATGTRPFERQAYFPPCVQSDARHSPAAVDASRRDASEESSSLSGLPAAA